MLWGTPRANIAKNGFEGGELIRDAVPREHVKVLQSTEIISAHKTEKKRNSELHGNPYS